MCERQILEPLMPSAIVKQLMAVLIRVFGDVPLGWRYPSVLFGSLAIAAFISGFRKQRPHFWFALAGFGFGLSIACKWSGLFALAVSIVGVSLLQKPLTQVMLATKIRDILDKP